METLARTAIVMFSVFLLGPLQLTAQSVMVNSPKLRIVDGTTYPRTSQGIQAAIKDVGQSPGTVFLSPGVYDISEEIHVSQPGIRIVGYGPDSSVLNVRNPTANVFNVTASRFALIDVGIRSVGPKTNGSVILMDADQGLVQNVRFDGNFWNGFTASSPLGGSWSLETIRVIGPASWNYLLRLASPTRTVASTHVRNLFVSNRINWKTASIVLDTGVDTFLCSEAELGPVLIQSTLGPQAPRWIRFVDVLIEAGIGGTLEGTGLQVDAARDLRYLGGYIASSRLAATIGSGARGVEIANTEFVSIGRSAVTIAAGARNVSIVNNTFEDIGIEANGTYDTVSVSAGATDFDISHNMFQSATSNRPRYNLALPAKCATCIADSNRFGGFATAAVAGGK